MWVMTKYGFYSAVEDYFDKEKKRVVVRARQRQDLENLIELGIGGITKESIVEDRTADYRYRIFITKADWANILAAEASQISKVARHEAARQAARRVTADPAGSRSRQHVTLAVASRNEDVARLRASARHLQHRDLQ